MPAPSPDPSLRVRLRRRAGGVLMDAAFRGVSRGARALPQFQPARHGVEVLRDIPYLDTGRHEHLLDIYQPIGGGERLPIVLYVHGGGFRILSKDTHFQMALAFASQGYLVFTINYRLAPKHPFPAAIEDASAAYAWMTKNAALYGGDLRRVILAGESAGANLACGLTVSACYEREEPWARTVWQTGVTPAACLPLCGVLQASDLDRFLHPRHRVPLFIADRLAEIESAYLGRCALEDPAQRALADPLCILEENRAPDRPLPPFFASVGTADFLKYDTRRLQIALHNLGATCETREYPREPHAFQALIWRSAAKQCWQDTFSFLRQHAPPCDSTP